MPEAVQIRSGSSLSESQKRVASREDEKSLDDASAKNMTTKITKPIATSIAYAPMRRPNTSVGLEYERPP